MSRFLIIDVGAGTMDILWYDSETGTHYKAVVQSPIRTLAEKAAGLKGDLLVTGVEMGGGSISQVLGNRANKGRVVMSVSSAATIHHDLDRVRALGIDVLEDDKAEKLKQDQSFSHLTLGDLETDRIGAIVQGLGVPFSLDVVGVCAQDHGVAAPGMSHLDYRHNLFKAILDENPYPQALLYRSDEVPATFNRLVSMAGSAERLPTKEVFVMDSGMAAILGATLDPRARSKKRIQVLDVATSHTVGASLSNGKIAGFFEYHTKDITLERVDDLLIDLAEGNLEHERILEEGGHGAYTRETPGFDSIEMIVATGPKRRLLEKSRHPMVLGAPLGDNMMTGTAGVLEAIGRRKGLELFSYS